MQKFLDIIGALVYDSYDPVDALLKYVRGESYG